jgi:DNA replication protein DnaC
MANLEAVRQHCKTLRLPTMAAIMAETLTTAQQESWSLETTLLNLLEQEVASRERRRIERLLKRSGLPEGKTLAQFDFKRMPLKAQRQLQQLAEGIGDKLSRFRNSQVHLLNQR